VSSCKPITTINLNPLSPFVNCCCVAIITCLLQQDMERRQLLLGRQVQPLDEEAALQLFSQWAGPASETLPPGLPRAEVIKACGRLPLALKVAGGLLYKNTDAEKWQVG